MAREEQAEGWSQDSLSSATEVLCVLRLTPRTAAQLEQQQGSDSAEA